MDLYSTLKDTKKWLKEFINGYRTTLSPSKNRKLSVNKLTQYPIRTKKLLKKFINGYRTTLSPSKNKDLSANKLTQYPIQWVEKQ